MRKIGQSLLDHPYRSMGLAAVFAALPLLGFLAAVLTGFVTLCRGYKTGLLILLGVAIPPLVLAIWKQSVFFDFLWLRCVLIWVLACLLRRTASWRLVLEVMTLVGIAVVLGFHLFLPDTAAWWTEFLSHYKNFLNSAFIESFSEEALREFIVQVAPMATGLLTALILLGAWGLLLAARWWQSALFRPGELSREFVEMRGGPVLAGVLTISAAAAFLGSAFAIDLLPVVILPLAIAGLSLLHKGVRYKKNLIYLLVMVYIGLIFLSQYFVIALALLGYIDSWYDLRKRYFSNSR